MRKLVFRFGDIGPYLRASFINNTFGRETFDAENIWSVRCALSLNTSRRCDGTIIIITIIVPADLEKSNVSTTTFVCFFSSVYEDDKDNVHTTVGEATVEWVRTLTDVGSFVTIYLVGSIRERTTRRRRRTRRTVR